VSTSVAGAVGGDGSKKRRCSGEFVDAAAAVLLERAEEGVRGVFEGKSGCYYLRCATAARH
jgi:hypothetical protein